MTDRTTLVRQWHLVRILSLSHRGLTLHELASEFDVSDRTVRRDLDALSLGGFHLEESLAERGRKRWRLRENDGVAIPGLTVDEIAALYLGRRLMEPLAGTAVWDSAQSGFLKLRQQLGSDAVSYVESLAKTLCETTFGKSDYSERAEIIDALMIGVNQSRVTRLLYHPLRSDSPEDYTLYPLGLVWHRGTLYLVATSADRSEPRHFKLDRARDVEVLTESFTWPADFHLQEHLHDTLGVYRTDAPLTEVRIRFSSDVARYVTEHCWHPSQQMEEQADGSLIVELQLSDLTEVKSWALSFGANAEVLSPEPLRSSIREELRSLLEVYESPQDRRSQAIDNIPRSDERSRS